MTSLLPTPELQFFQNVGGGNIPAAGGSVATYIPNTMTPKVTYQDPLGTIPNSNPVILDSYGRGLFYGAGSYRFIVSDSNGNLIYDQVTNSSLSESAVSAVMLPIIGAMTTATALSLLGVTGANGAIAQAVGAIQLMPGPAGPTGAQGPQGLIGPTGPAGAASTVFSSYANQTGNRALNTDYTNSGAGPLAVSVSFNTDGLSGCAGYVDGVNVISAGANDGGGGGLTYGMMMIVPAGSIYGVAATGGSGNTLVSWFELS